LISVIVLFAAPVILLGMVSPFVIRLRIRQLETAGNAAGAVYALSTLGSILGTFVPVFWLIPTYGTRPTIFVLAFLLGAISAAGLYEPGRRRLYLLIPVLIVALALLSGGAIRPATYGTRVFETESAYNYIQVVKSGTETQLLLDEGSAVHSIYDPTSLYTHGYWDDVLLAPYFGSGRVPGRVALVGLAGGTVARQFTAIDGPIPIDGVELDPKIVDVGRRYFQMTEPNLHVTVADGRYWMATEAGRYDVILVDAYRQPYIPFYLTTREFFANVRAHLRAGGVVIINVGHPPGSDALERVVSATLRAAFPVVVRDPSERTNTLVVASTAPVSAATLTANASGLADPLRPLAFAAAARLAPALSGGAVYTDDRAPVEWLIDQAIVDYAAHPQ
jgi:spermidine synthase